MIKRDTRWRPTRIEMEEWEMVDIAFSYPSLHAFGVGFNMFKNLPEDKRLAAIEYSKWLLAYSMADEIKSAMQFMRALQANEQQAKVSWYVKLSYLMGLYRYWRKISDREMERVPPGAFIVAALFYGQGVHVRPDLRPDCLITIPKMRREYLENYLERDYGYVRPPDSEVYYDFYAVSNDDRADEVGNEPQGVDAIFNVNGEDNGERIWRQADNTNGTDFVSLPIREGQEPGPGEGREIRSDAFDPEDGGHYAPEEDSGGSVSSGVRDKVRKSRKAKASAD